MNASQEKIILTGASDGIGRAMAVEFARLGARLGLIARRKEKLEEVKAECLDRGAKQVEIFAVDVTHEADFENALIHLDEKLDGATGFIANAGVTGRSSFKAEAWKEAKHCLQVNVLAAVHGLEVMKLRMLRRGSGTLAGVSSVAAARGMPTSGAYSASKAALSTYLETLRVDLTRAGIRVVNIAPGFIDTEMTKKNKGTMPFLISAEEAAKVFVKGYSKGLSFVTAPAPWRWIYPVLQMMPNWLFDAISRRTYKQIRG